MSLKEFMIIFCNFALLNTGILVCIHKIFSTDHWITFIASAPIAYWFLSQIFQIGQGAKESLEGFNKKIDEAEKKHNDRAG